MSTAKHRRLREEKNRALKLKIQALSRSVGVEGLTVEKYQYLLTWILDHPFKIFLRKITRKLFARRFGQFRYTIDFEAAILEIFLKKQDANKQR